MSQDKNFFEFIQHGVAGSTGAALSTFLLFPIDNIKLRMQIDAKRQEKSMSMKQKCGKVFRKEGLTGFYKGILPTIVGNFISNFTYFMCYNYLKYISQEQQILSDSLKFIVCTFIAGILTSIVTNPFWVIQSAQTNSKKQITFFETIQMLGFKKLFKGLSASFILVLNPIINYFIYENIKIITVQYQGSEYESLIYFFSGGLGKFIATIITYPYQLLRTYSHVSTETSMLKMTKNIIKNQGIMGLYGGLQAKIYQSVLNNAFTLMFYENLFQFQLKLFKNLDDTATAFGLKLFAICIICVYVSSQQVKFNQMYYLFFGGAILSITGNLIYLLNNQKYQIISLGLFATGILFYIHSMISNLSRSKRKNRHAMVYVVIALVIIIFLSLEKYIEKYNNFKIELKDIIAGGLVFTLVVLSVMRYSKTSKKSFFSTIIGVFFLGISARFMYMGQSEDYVLNPISIYIICGVQVLSMILLITGTISHRKYIITKGRSSSSNLSRKNSQNLSRKNSQKQQRKNSQTKNETKGKLNQESLNKVTQSLEEYKNLLNSDKNEQINGNGTCKISEITEEQNKNQENKKNQ